MFLQALSSPCFFVYILESSESIWKHPASDGRQFEGFDCLFGLLFMRLSVNGCSANCACIAPYSRQHFNDSGWRLFFLTTRSRPWLQNANKFIV